MTTKLRWSQMGARKRDSLIAERVMGWKLDQAKLFWEKPDGKFEAVEGDNYNGWSPTTDHNAAHEVVEAMRARGFKVKLTIGPEHWWTVTTHSEADYPKTRLSSAGTMPEALCKAALRACGVEVEE